jgi:hypothetical protein
MLVSMTSRTPHPTFGLFAWRVAVFAQPLAPSGIKIGSQVSDATVFGPAAAPQGCSAKKAMRGDTNPDRPNRLRAVLDEDRT